MALVLIYPCCHQVRDECHPLPCMLPQRPPLVIFLLTPLRIACKQNDSCFILVFLTNDAKASSKNTMASRSKSGRWRATDRQEAGSQVGSCSTGVNPLLVLSVLCIKLTSPQDINSKLSAQYHSHGLRHRESTLRIGTTSSSTTRSSIAQSSGRALATQ
jgi:hypothetical protein